jgi:DNA polymerase-3 subunit delta'
MKIIGHQKIWQLLKKSVESGKLSHAYLFTGQEKLGKRTLALEFIKMINGADALKKDYLDLIFIRPEDEGVIQISQIRELSRKLSLKSYSNFFKTAIIDNTHLMTQEAQGALLKTLEEPKGKVLLILITEFPESILPTILSRTQKIKFFLVNKKEIKEYLIKEKLIKEKEAEEISEFSNGKPGVAIDFISDIDKLKNQKKIVEELIIISKADLSFRFQYAKNLYFKNNIKEVLDIWLRYFRKALILRINSKINLEEINKFKKIIEQIQNINFLISTTNVNIRLALEILMLKL